MQEIVEEIINYLKGIWLKKFYIALTMWVICPVGWYVVFNMPDHFAAKAQVYVDTQSLLRPLLRGLAVQPNTDHQVQLIVRTLMTRPNLEKIARMADLDVQTKNKDEYEKMIDRVKENLSITAAGRENIYTISYRGETPAKTRDVVQAALDVFIENTLGETRSEADSAEQFLDRQIKEYENRLLEDERRLTDFKQQNSNLLGVNVGGYYSTLDQNKQRLAESRLQLREVESRLASARSQLKGEEPTFGLIQQRTMTNTISTQYDGRIEQLKSQLDELSLKYTEKHPNIMELKRRIEDLETQRAAEIKAAVAQQQGDHPTFENLDTNPVYQEMKLSVTRLENEKVSLDVRVAEYESKVREIEEKIHLIPEMESQLISLNRGYDITKNKYNELLTRREQARLSQSADLTADDIQFKVVDPPVVPRQPSGPNRVLFLTVVTLFSMIAGVGIAFGLSQLNPVAISGSQLTRVTGYPVFGTISSIDLVDASNKDRLYTILFAGAVAAAVIIYFVLVGIQLNAGFSIGQ
ncbi:MAG: chain length determinant family protein [Hahellaceae bacterium]|jgi:polysaccharide chain length determinant protein (PEP-CTERM system associated)|nr:chain length determinant family protein [Hahellaceae bacterium]